MRAFHLLALAASLGSASALGPGPVQAQAAQPPGGAVGAQDAAAVSILERAAARYEALAAFCADFRQQIDVTVLRETVRSQGELCQARPDRFEMRWSDPAGDRVVADGTFVWTYFQSIDPGQVFRSSLGGDTRLNLHEEFLSDPERRYAARLDGREIVDGRACHILLLTPRGPSTYRQARIWIDEADLLIRRLVIVEEGESIRTLDLTNIRLNPSLDAARFVFTPPSGVQVISQ